MFIKRSLWVSSLSFILAACQGIGLGVGDVKISEFTIDGSSPDLEEGRVTLDSSIDDGRFKVIWKVDDDNSLGYVARLYLSVNDALSRNRDIRFASFYCDGISRCDHDKRNDEDCYFNNDLEMYCGDEDEFYKYEVDELIDALPADLYIIVEACNDFDCDTQAVPVRLR
jgi:hypothetical protein